MQLWNYFSQSLAENWNIWFVSAVLVAAAIIDGWKLKVPNWITFPFVVSGWIYSTTCFGWAGFGWSLMGTCVGLALLLPAYAIGGMGAGDVKLLAGVGAWIWGTTLYYAFCFSAIIGGVIALAMVFCKPNWRHHSSQLWTIIYEILIIRQPNQLSSIAADRKGSMMLLPYGIPIAIGTITYFIWTGMLP